MRHTGLALIALLAPAALAADGTPLYVDMVGTHWALATDARDALIRGDLPQAKAQLAALGKHKVHKALQGDLEILAYQLKSAAHDGGRAKTTGTLGEALGRAAVACGTCHTAAKVPFEAPIYGPPEGEGILPHMARHAWAVDRLWQGLFAADEAAWNTGIASLADEVPVADATVPADREAAVAAMTRLIHDQEAAAKEATTWGDRGALFGDLVATCADCHVETRPPVTPKR